MSRTGKMFPFSLSRTSVVHKGMKGTQKLHSLPVMQRSATSHPNKHSLAAESCSPPCCLQSNLSVLAVPSWRAGRQGPRCSAEGSRAWLQMRRKSGSYSPTGRRMDPGQCSPFLCPEPWVQLCAGEEQADLISPGWLFSSSASVAMPHIAWSGASITLTPGSLI